MRLLLTFVVLLLVTVWLAKTATSELVLYWPDVFGLILVGAAWKELRC